MLTTAPIPPVTIIRVRSDQSFAAIVAALVLNPTSQNHYLASGISKVKFILKSNPLVGGLSSFLCCSVMGGGVGRPDTKTVPSNLGGSKRAPSHLLYPQSG